MDNVNRCSICNSSEYTFLFTAIDNLKIKDEAYNIVRCNTCQTVRLLNPPLESEIHNYYPVRYFGKTPDPESKVNRSKKKILQKYLNQGKILDFGCGDCSFLLSLDSRYEKFGFDKIEHTEKDLIVKNKITLWNGSIFEQNIPDDFFDAVTFWASLEHTYNPKALLEYTRSKLKSDGILIILLQNFDSIQSRIFKANWMHLDAPRHIYSFSTKTLSRLLYDLGFKIMDVVHDNTDYNIPGFTDSLRLYINNRRKIQTKSPRNFNSDQKDSSINKPGSVSKKSKIIKLIELFFSYPLYLAEIITGRGGIITIAARK
jgi:hypothetical protein